MAMVLLAPALAACGNTDAEDAEAARARWRERGPSSYVYVVAAGCLECGLGFSRVVVENGAVTDAVEMSTGLPRLEGSRTMDDIMNLVVELAKQDNDEFEVSYSEQLGYVRKLRVDQSETASDDQLAIGVDCLAAGTGPEVCPLRSVTAQECPGEASPIVPEPGWGRPICADRAAPIGRISDSELVCCPGAAGRSCAELEALVKGELPALQQCEQDDDCGTGLFQDCKYARAVTADAAALMALLRDSTAQECILDLGPDCVPGGRPSCVAGHCEVH